MHIATKGSAIAPQSKRRKHMHVYTPRSECTRVDDMPSVHGDRVDMCRDSELWYRRDASLFGTTTHPCRRRRAHKVRITSRAGARRE